MKRKLSLVLLLGVLMGAVLSGCNPSTEPAPPAGTNAAPATNAP